MIRAGLLTVLACAIFLTIATFHQTNIFKNDLITQLESDDLQVDKSISDVDVDNHRKYWKKVKRGKKGIKYLNELNGKDVNNHFLFNLKHIDNLMKKYKSSGKSMLSCIAMFACLFLNLSISENYQFPEVEPEECVRTSEGDI